MAATVLSAKVSTKFAADLRREIFHQVQDFSAAEMERFGTASLVTRSTSDVTNIQMFLSLLLRLGVTAPLMAVAGLVLSSLTGGELSSVLSLAIPALIIGVGVILIFVSRYSVTLRQRIDRLNKIFLETLEGVRVIRAFNRQGKEMERFSQANGTGLHDHSLWAGDRTADAGDSGDLWCDYSSGHGHGFLVCVRRGDGSG